MYEAYRERRCGPAISRRGITPCMRQYYWWRGLIRSPSHGLLPELSNALGIDQHRRSCGLEKDLKRRLPQHQPQSLYIYVTVEAMIDHVASDMQRTCSPAHTVGQRSCLESLMGFRFHRDPEDHISILVRWILESRINRIFMTCQ